MKIKSTIVVCLNDWREVQKVSFVETNIYTNIDSFAILDHSRMKNDRIPQIFVFKATILYDLD